MAIVNGSSTQYINQTTPNVLLNSADHGRVKALSIDFTQVGAGDIGSVQSLIMLPAGRLKILTGMSSLKTSAFGTSRTLSVGYAAYTALDGTAKALSTNYFASAIDVSSSATVSFGASGLKLSQDIDSRSGVVIQSTIAGGTIPDGATLTGVLLYVAA